MHTIIDLTPVSSLQLRVDPNVVIEIKPLARALEYVLVATVDSRGCGIIPLHVDLHVMILFFLRERGEAVLLQLLITWQSLFSLRHFYGFDSFGFVWIWEFKSTIHKGVI